MTVGYGIGMLGYYLIWLIIGVAIAYYIINETMKDDKEK